MDVSEIIDPLNDAQRQAVCAEAGNVLVLAGAGSGKTRVLVHRMAWLLQIESITPYQIMAVTFTNKAAKEMRSRIENLLGIPSSGMWVGTFHGIAHRLLRAHWNEAGLTQSFQVMDSDDQFRILKRVIREMGLDESQWPAKESQWYISARKDEGQRPQHLDHKGDMHLKYMIEIYQQYENYCQRSALVDFAELLLRAHELLLNNPSLLQHYQQRFQYLLVDEFQDTNTIQYAWIRLLAGKTGQIFAVGDDDQSIYGWRGAKIENIYQFNKDFNNATTFRLEQNYRSTGNILNAANVVIANNNERLGKELWTEDGDGELIQLYAAYNERDEAQYISDQISEWVDKGGMRADCAMLYRSNAQSRVLEEALMYRGIPYRIYGGLRFFERQEIKDTMAYLRLINNLQDDASFERIINVPTRGIGARTVEIIREGARDTGLGLWQAAHNAIENKLLSARALNAVQAFVQLIEQLKENLKDLSLQEKIEHTLHESGLIDHYKKEKGEKGRARLENLEELVTAGRTFSDDAEEIVEEDESMADMDELTAFISHAALEAGEGQGDEWEDCVQLMTLHSAKGLEFKQVFLCGLEEGLFPHRLSSEDSSKLEEERRLCYVGMTRAMENLYISYAEKRRLYGEEKFARVSRFVGEIPKEYIEEVRLSNSSIGASALTPIQSNTVQDDEAPVKLGQRVVHKKFGEGIVMNYEGRGKQARIQINFAVGAKWLVMEYANLQF